MVVIYLTPVICIEHNRWYVAYVSKICDDNEYIPEWFKAKKVLFKYTDMYSPL